MGMDIYNSSPAARAVWDGAGAHLLAVYGFSIIEIVKDNPMEMGQAIRQRYMEMTYDMFNHPTDLQSLSS
jgi:fatty acid synthase subunit beta